MNVAQKYLPINTKRRSGLKNLGVKFIVCHDTGNDGSTALQNVSYYINSANDIEASAHVFIDHLGALECIPDDEKAWHVRRTETVDNLMFGGDANDIALGVELCFSTRGIFDSRTAYKNYVEYIACLLKKYNLDTTKLVGHHSLDPLRRQDPINAFSTIQKTWTDFLCDVKNALVITIPGESNASKVARAKAILDTIV